MHTKAALITEIKRIGFSFISDARTCKIKLKYNKVVSGVSE